MLKLKPIAVVCLAIAGMMVASVAVEAQGAGKPQCVQKASEGTNTTEEGAKFQAYEALLQATDWGLWAAWMANGKTPGYDVAKPKYACVKGAGLGFKCRAQTTICKKA